MVSMIVCAQQVTQAKRRKSTVAPQLSTSKRVQDRLAELNASLKAANDKGEPATEENPTPAKKLTRKIRSFTDGAGVVADLELSSSSEDSDEDVQVIDRHPSYSSVGGVQPKQAKSMWPLVHRMVMTEVRKNTPAIPLAHTGSMGVTAPPALASEHDNLRVSKKTGQASNGSLTAKQSVRLAAPPTIREELARSSSASTEMLSDRPHHCSCDEKFDQILAITKELKRQQLDMASGSGVTNAAVTNGNGGSQWTMGKTVRAAGNGPSTGNVTMPGTITSPENKSSKRVPKMIELQQQLDSMSQQVALLLRQMETAKLMMSTLRE